MEENFKFIKMKKHVLKVHIHCQGCEKKVKKLVGKIEGVYKVKIECELQKVIVWGNVECTTLMNKLVKSGKHAELWRAPPPTYNWVKDDEEHGRFPIWDEWDSNYPNNHHMEMDQREDDTMSFPSYDTLPQFNTREENSITSYPTYTVLPQFNTRNENRIMNFPADYNNLQSPYLGFPVYDYHTHPMKMYNMHAPQYNHPYSMMYHQ